MYFDFSMDMVKDNIKSTKRAIRTNYGLFIMNAGLVILNGSLVYKGVSNLVGEISLGALSVNCLWILLHIIDYRMDLKLDKQRLTYMDEHRDNENVKESIKQHQQSKEWYDKAYAVILEDRVREEQKRVRESNSSVQCQAGSQNCN